MRDVEDAVPYARYAAREAAAKQHCFTGDRKGRPYEQIRSCSEGKYHNYALCIMHYAFTFSR